MKRNPKQNIRVVDARMINMSGIGTYIKIIYVMDFIRQQWEILLILKNLNLVWK